MRFVKGVPELLGYLKSIGVDISSATVHRLIRKKEIPFKRINTQVLLFDLNKIDKWLSGDEVSE